MAGFAENGGLFSYMIESVRKTLFSNEPIGEIQPNQSGWTVERQEWRIPENQQRKRTPQPCSGWKFLQGKGVHQGRLLGGCFEVLDWLRGTDFFPSLEQWQGAILFLETSEEAPSSLIEIFSLNCAAWHSWLDTESTFHSSCHRFLWQPVVENYADPNPAWY